MSTPLYDAASKNDVNEIKTLLDGDADPNAKDKNSGTPLHDAAFSGQSIGITTLLGMDANFNAENKFGSTPLRVAIANGHTDAANILRNAGAVK